LLEVVAADTLLGNDVGG